MCASFAPPKPPAAFTVGKVGQESAGASRRRQTSTPRRSRSPSPQSQESLNGLGGGRAFGKEDFANALSAGGWLRGGGGGSNGGASDGSAFATSEGAPPPLSITPKARGGYSLDRAGPSTAPGAASAPVPLVSPTGDERPASFRSPSAAAAAAATDADGFAADSPTAAASGAARGFTAAASAHSHPVAAIPTFSEMAQGAIRAGGDLPLEPFARARIRAAEEGWARKEAEREERERRRRVKMLSYVTLVVLVFVLACRCIGVGIVIRGSAGQSPPTHGTNKLDKPPSSTAPPQRVLSSAAGEMPAIASSKDEFVAAVQLAGLKNPKPARVDRAWSALASGENRGAAGTYHYYVGGGVLAAKVVVAGALRNPDFVAVLAVAIATFVLFARRRRPWGWGGAVGNRGGGGGVRGGGEAANGGGGARAAGLLRPGARGAGGVGAVNGHAGNGVGVKPGVRVGMRGASSLSPRRLAGS